MRKAVNDTLKRLYDSHSPALLLYARTWCRAPEDAIQEAFIELARQPNFPPEPVAWLFKTVRFRAINLNRGEQRRSRREQEVALNQPPFFVSTPQQWLDSTDLEDALKSLSQEQREIVIARIWGGLSFEQIAKLNGNSSSTVHRRYHESLEELKRILDGMPCEEVNHE